MLVAVAQSSPNPSFSRDRLSILGDFMKKLTIRKVEALKTTAAFYAGGCGAPIDGPPDLIIISPEPIFLP